MTCDNWGSLIMKYDTSLIPSSLPWVFLEGRKPLSVSKVKANVKVYIATSPLTGHLIATNAKPSLIHPPGFCVNMIKCEPTAWTLYHNMRDMMGQHIQFTVQQM